MMRVMLTAAEKLDAAAAVIQSLSASVEDSGRVIAAAQLHVGCWGGVGVDGKGLWVAY